jgi:MFS transporter, DHA2 family, methylenomycin A resistance protein
LTPGPLIGAPRVREHPTASTPDAASKGDAIVPVVIGLGAFVSYLDASIASAVFPSILTDFDREVAATSWVVNASNLALTTGLVVGGALADTHGRRRMFRLGLHATAAFAAASMLAPDLGWLIACRVGVGLAGALLLASSLALIASAVRPEKQAAAVGIYAAIGGLGSLVGPILGAAATAWLSWRWALGSLIPIGLAGAWLGLRWLPPDTDLRRVPIHYVAGVAIGLCITGLLLALTQGTSRGWSSPIVVTAEISALALGAAFVLLELRSTRPLFPAQLRSKPYVRALIGISGLGLVLGASLFAIPLFVTQVQGGSPSAASLSLVPAAFLAAPAALLSGRLAARFGYGLPSGIGLLFATFAPLALALLDVSSSYASVLCISAFSGIGIGMGIPAMAGSALAAARQADAGSGAGWYHSMRVLGIALGVVAFAILSSQTRSSDSAREASLSRVGAASAQTADEVVGVLERTLPCERMDCVEQRLKEAAPVSPEVAEAVRHGMRRKLSDSYHGAFLWCAALASISLLGWLLLRNEGSTPGVYRGTAGKASE